MIPNRLLSMIGLAMKAGKIASGEFSTEKETKAGNARLVIVAGDASDNTKKKFRNMCEFYKVPIYFCFSKEELGHGIGRENRASLAVLDDGFAQAMLKILDTENKSRKTKTEVEV